MDKKKKTQSKKQNLENLEEKMIDDDKELILEELRYWEEEYQPSSNMGKWYASIRIERLKKKLKYYGK